MDKKLNIIMSMRSLAVTIVLHFKNDRLIIDDICAVYFRNIPVILVKLKSLISNGYT